MYYVYILISEKNPQKYYIGISEDVETRLKSHNGGFENYTKAYIPWKIETFIGFENKDLAFKFEKYLKHGSGHAFLKRHLLPK